MLSDEFMLGARELAERGQRTLGAQSEFVAKLTSAMIETLDAYEQGRPVLVAAVESRRNLNGVASLLHEAAVYADAEEDSIA